MGHLEEEILTRHPKVKADIYARYVDEIFISADTKNQISNLINKVKENSRLNFTHKIEDKKTLP